MKSNITLRPYQTEAVETSLDGLKKKGNSLLVLAQGAGKSLIQAEIGKRLDEDVLILQPNAEVTLQNKEKMLNYVDESEVGIYSASLSSREIKKYTYATIGSIRNIPESFSHFKYVILDECDLLNPKEQETMLNNFLRSIGQVKVLGMTGTPYRQDKGHQADGMGGWIPYTTTKLINRVRPKFWDRVVYALNTKDLLTQGYLCPLKYEDRTFLNQNDMKLNATRSDFDLEMFEECLKSEEDQIIDTIYSLWHRHTILVFCTSIVQAERLSSLTRNSAVVTANTKKKDRAEIVRQFKTGEIKVVFNVNAFSVGFDSPYLDTLVLLRPTRSLRWYGQALGRGSRLATGKTECLVVDFTNTVKNLGKLETIEVTQVNGMWEILSETGSWHNKPLFDVQMPAPRVNDIDINRMRFKF